MPITSLNHHSEHTSIVMDGKKMNGQAISTRSRLNEKCRTRIITPTPLTTRTIGMTAIGITSQPEKESTVTQTSKTKHPQGITPSKSAKNSKNGKNCSILQPNPMLQTDCSEDRTQLKEDLLPYTDFSKRLDQYVFTLAVSGTSISILSPRSFLVLPLGYL